MVLNAKKRRQLAEIALKRKAAPGPSTADAPIHPVDQRQKGVAEATATEDEDTCLGLVFTRKRKVDVAVPTNLASDNRAPSFRENPPSASSPHDIVVHESGRESASGGDHGTPPVDLPAFLQWALQSFQDRERIESMDEDPLQKHATKCPGDFVASSLNLTKMQELKEAASQHALQIKEFKRRETVLYLEVSDLRQTDKETKKLLFEKS